MAKSTIICAKSGIAFECEYLPAIANTFAVMHPFFLVPQKTLLTCADRWANMEFGNEETFLYFLSLLDSSGLIVWRAPAYLSEETVAIANANMEKLLLVIERISRLNAAHLQRLPRYAIDTDTNDLSTIPEYITSWNEAIDESIKGYKTVAEIFAEQEQESAIERLIRSPYRTNDRELAWKLAQWAESTGKFPKFLTQAPNGKSIPLNELWKEIIKACVDDDRIHHIPRSDLEELIEHVIDNIPQGTIHAQKLLQFLRTALAKKTDMLSLGFGNENLAGKKTSFTIVRNDSQRAGAFLNTILSQAPQKEPKREEFKSLAEFLRAKAKWNLANNGNNSVPTMADEIKREMADNIVDDSADYHDPDFYPSEDEFN